jgi:hypothetical protein
MNGRGAATSRFASAAGDNLNQPRREAVPFPEMDFSP